MLGTRSMRSREPTASGVIAALREGSGICIQVLHHSRCIWQGAGKRPGQATGGSRSAAKGAIVVVGIVWNWVGRTRHDVSIRREGSRKRGLSTTTCLAGTDVGRLVLLLCVWTAVRRRRSSVDSHRPRTDATRCLQSKCWAGEGRGVDCRHPDARLVDLEEIRDERVEIDVRVGEVVEG